MRIGGKLELTVEEWLGKDNQIGLDIWRRKYQYENESFEEWLDRVSGGDRDVKDLIRAKKFLFGGRILANRGLDKRGKKISLSNCYVVSSPEDNIESIFDTAKKLARTYSYGGGCGVDISKLAPKGAKVNNAASETSGATSFMDLFSLTTELIGQNGRRGALMISISCEHPDIEDFITIKTDVNRVNKANISIRMTDKFMEAAKNGECVTLSFTRPETGETIEKVVNAKEILMDIAKTNWDYGEPGMLFWDRITTYNLLQYDKEFELVATNPCGEEPLPAGGSCLLGSINLCEFVRDPFTNPAFDYCCFEKAVCTAVRALNTVLDEGMPLHPLREQRESVYNWRQIGLGIMGLGDMLIMMGLRYGSEESIKLCDKIGYLLADNALFASAKLASSSKPFPKYKTADVYLSSAFCREHSGNADTVKMIKEFGLRNSQLLTCAPTGTLSTMLGISGGIEPEFSFKYTRKTESLFGEDKYYTVYANIVDKYVEATGNSPENLPAYFIDAMHLDYRDRIRMQAVWQGHIDASISSTVNVPEEFTVEDVYNMYMFAYESRLKGVTLFRTGCKRGAILTPKKEESKSGESKENKDEETSSISETSGAIDSGKSRGEIIEVNDNAIGFKRKLITGCGTLHCEAFFDPQTGDLVETYLSKGSTGGCNNFMVGLSRMISVAARGGVPIEKIVDQLNSTGVCPSYAVRRATKHDTSTGSCCPMAVGNALMSMQDEMRSLLNNSDISGRFSAKINVSEIDSNDDCESETTIDESLKCPECGSRLIFEGGCNICKNCGWSRCM